MPYSIIYVYSLLHSSYTFRRSYLAIFMVLTQDPFGSRKNKCLYTKNNYYVATFNF
jgi:hypothetical protein